MTEYKAKGIIMSRNRKIPSLVKQVCDVLNPMFDDGFCRPKFKDKPKGEIKDKIYAYDTLDSYKKACIRFVKYCKKEHGCRTLKQCRKYVNEYLRSRFHLSARTVELDKSAIVKMYQCSPTEFIKTPPRRRADITRSRLPAVRDAHFSEKNNDPYIKFCRSVGGRACEMSMLRGTDLEYINKKPYIHFTRNTKNDRPRYTPIIGDVDFVVDMMRKAGDSKVFKKIPSNADTHAYRGEYAQALYDMLARPIDQIPYDKVNKGTGRRYQSEVYVCRGDKKGVKYDRKAMLQVSRALGHNRVSVIASNYLY